MKHLFVFILCSVFILSCRTEHIELKSPNGIEFFTSKAQLKQEVQKAIAGDFPVASSVFIKDVAYYEDSKKSVGLVTYEANGTERTNILFVITPTSKKMYKCTTANCGCRVDIYKGDSSEVIYECGGCGTDCHWEVSNL